MPHLPWYLIAILIIATGVLLRDRVRRRRMVRNLRREQEETKTEERLVFDFLHHLGIALQRESSSNAIHRVIVDGVSRVMRAKGGALYVINQEGERLIPSHYSKQCPPLIPLPERIQIQARMNPSTLGSYLRLSSIQSKDGIFGKVYQSQLPVIIEDLTSHPDFPAEPAPQQQQISLMAAPLTYGDKKLGVLIVANDRTGRRFTQNDFQVFKSVAEQSSYALGHALAQQEVETKRRLEEEVRNASEVQRILLPTRAPALSEYEVAGLNLAARLVSGDYYDYIPIDDTRHGVIIADVSGKGIPAALIMAMCRGVIRMGAVNTPSPSEVLRRVNRQLFPDIREDMFISLAYLVLQKETSEILLSRAGHDAPLQYLAKTQEVIRHDPPGLAIGVDSGDVFDRIVKDHPIHMDKGDMILLYTDGVTEALNRQGGEFGIERLMKLFAATAPSGPNEVLEKITGQLRDFMGSLQPNDDITLIAIQKK